MLVGKETFARPLLVGGAFCALLIGALVSLIAGAVAAIVSVMGYVFARSKAVTI